MGVQQNGMIVAAAGLDRQLVEQPGFGTGAPPVVTVVVDSGDDVDVTQAALAAHDPPAGQITVHPTPGTQGLANLACDVLMALGKDARVAAQRRDLVQLWRQATAWTRAAAITQIVMLRAHLLSAVGVARLVQLAADTGAALTLVWHRHAPSDWRRQLPTATLHVLDAVQADFTAIGLAPVPVPAEALPLYCPPLLSGRKTMQRAVSQPLPPLPDTEVTRYRADLYRRLGRSDFARADALYAAGMDSACAFLTGHRDYTDELATGQPGMTARAAAVTADTEGDAIGGNTVGDGAAADRVLPFPVLYPLDWADTRALRDYLVWLVVGSPSADHSIALIRGAQAGFLRHGLLLEAAAPGQRSGPGFGEVAFSAQVAGRIRAQVADPLTAAALALLLITDLDLDELNAVRVADLSPDATRLTIGDEPERRRARDPGLGAGRGMGSGVSFAIPPWGRDLMEAARCFVRLASTRPEARLFTSESVIAEWPIRQAAFACGLEPPALLQRSCRQLAWHLRARCVWAGGGIHGNYHVRPELEKGRYAHFATQA